MTIASEVQRIKTNIANAYDKCEEKGATMPDNENSANLADTIDSIPAGGGEVDTMSMAYNPYFNKKDADSALNFLETEIPQTDRASYTWDQIYTNKHLEDKGWIKVQTANSPIYTIISYAVTATEVYLNKGYLCGLKSVSSDTIIESFDSNYYKITFNGENRSVIVLYRYTFYASNFYRFGTWTNSSSDYRGVVAGIYCADVGSTPVYVEELKSGSSYNDFQILLAGDFYTKTNPLTLKPSSRYKIKWTPTILIQNATSSVAKPLTYPINMEYVYELLLGGMTCDELLERTHPSELTADGYIQLLDTYVTDGGVTVTGVKTNFYRWLGSYRYSEDKNDLIFMCAKAGYSKVPFIVDLSQAPTNLGTWYPTYAHTSPYYDIPNITDMHIILPSSDAQLIQLTNLSLESYQWLATNAPTVTGKYLYLPVETRMKMTYFSDWAAVKTTLTNKGWTVS